MLPQEFNLNIEKLYKLLFNDDSTVQSKMIALQKEEGFYLINYIVLAHRLVLNF